MEPVLRLDTDPKTPKYLQVVNSINEAIRRGELRRGDQVFSINELSDEFFLGRDTVQKAYNILRKKGVLTAVPGKGFYINRTDVANPYRILLLFNKLSHYKKQVYDAFVATMGDKASVDLKIHHSNAKLFKDLLLDHLRDYDYFVIMPHFYDHQEEIRSIIQRIPAEKLVILDKDLSFPHAPYTAVFQDFARDIYVALEEAMDLLRKYQKLVLVQPRVIAYPPEIATGFRLFCTHNHIPWDIIPEIAVASPIGKTTPVGAGTSISTEPPISPRTPTGMATPTSPGTPIHPGVAYIVIEETDLVNLIKLCASKKWTVGADVGILSYNETPLKEILLDGITVLSTDHSKMGEMVATLILENRREKLKNPFRLIKRASL
jgi:DNA-binding transcriptional regulator YhcF (GntR family)